MPTGLAPTGWDTGTCCNQTIWNNWVIVTTCGSATSSGTSNVWYQWASDTTTATTTCTPIQNNLIWVNWIGENVVSQVVNQYVPAAPSAEQLAAEREEHERRRQESLRQAQVAKAAEERARGLLHEHLTTHQREQLDKHGWFLVEGGKSKKQYRIRADAGYSGNITELEGSKVVASLCVHAAPNIPLSDHLLAQLLCLRHDEEHIVKTANRRAA